MVKRPTVAMVKRPTHLQETTAPKLKPLNINHIHQLSENGRTLSSFVKPVKLKRDRDVKKSRGESRRI